MEVHTDMLMILIQWMILTLLIMLIVILLMMLIQMMILILLMIMIKRIDDADIVDDTAKPFSCSPHSRG